MSYWWLRFRSAEHALPPRLTPFPGSERHLPPCRGPLTQDQSTHLLLEYRCTRYFYMEGAGTFVPVPAVAKGFNAQLQRAAETLAATGQATALDEQDWDLPDKQLRWGRGARGLDVVEGAAWVRV